MAFTLIRWANDSFVTEFPSGPNSVLGVYVPAGQNYNLCKADLSMPVTLRAYNGASIEQTTRITATGCGGVAGFKVTRASRLAQALAACHRSKNRPRRRACERVARKRYGAKPAIRSHG